MKQWALFQMYTFPTRPLLFSAYCSSMKSSSAAVHPRQKKKCRHLRVKKKKKKGAIKITHPHTHKAQSAVNGENSTPEWFNQAFFPLAEVTVRMKYAIILFKRGLPVWGGGWAGRGRDGFSLKIRGGINGINKAGCLCLSSALSVSPTDINVVLNASLTANGISRKIWRITRRFSLVFSPCQAALSQSAILIWDIRAMITWLFPLKHSHICTVICATTIEILI